MSDVLKYEFNNCSVNIYTEDPNALQESLSSAATTVVSKLIPPRIGALWVEQGGVYVGVLRGENGAPDYHLIHAHTDYETSEVTWDQATDNAKADNEGYTDWSLPDRSEARLLYINSPSGFNTDKWYWTSTQGAAYDGCAWMQVFVNGFQLDFRKSYSGRARAVRRVLIID